MHATDETKRFFLIVVMTLCFCAGCKRGPTLDLIKPGELNLEFTLSFPGNAPMKEVADIYRTRLKNAGARDFDLQIESGTKIRVKARKVKSPEPIKALLLLQGTLAFYVVDESSTYLKDAYQQLTEAERQAIFLDSWMDKQHEIQRLTWRSNQPEILRAACQRVAEAGDGPKDRILGIGQDGKDSTAYLLYAAPALTNEIIKDVGIEKDPATGTPRITIEMTESGAKSFADFTETQKGRRIAIVLEHNVVSAPVVQERISGGKAPILFGTSGDPTLVRGKVELWNYLLSIQPLPAKPVLEEEKELE